MSTYATETSSVYFKGIPSVSPSFEEKLKEEGHLPLNPSGLEIFQVNVGYMCNQVCNHCHVDAGPHRKEIMTREVMGLCLEAIKSNDFKTVDITGGAPELNPDFRWFVEELRSFFRGDILVRCNLTIILANKRFHDLPIFFREHRIHVVSSLPFYSESKTDRQRGKGVFNKSISALKLLNAAGYGGGGELVLDLVYNPSGAFLPASQEFLEKQFKEELLSAHGIVFDQLLTITNLPINRFLDYLLKTDNYQEYMDRLIQAFNPSTITGLMCRNTLSVDYQGYLYDCDFNQMLGAKIESDHDHLNNFDADRFLNRRIKVGPHCFGCTAGSGSGCGGLYRLKGNGSAIPERSD